MPPRVFNDSPIDMSQSNPDAVDGDSSPANQVTTLIGNRTALITGVTKSMKWQSVNIYKIREVRLA